MQYTTEEAAMLSGLLMAYFGRHGVDVAIQSKYREICNHISKDEITQRDAKDIVASLDFIMESHEFEPVDKRLLTQLLVKTITYTKT